MDKRKPQSPSNMVPLEQHADAARTAQKKPSPGATSYEVRTRGIETFRRAGITFGPDPVEIDAADLTEEQKIELLNTEHLTVEEKGGSAVHSKAPAQPKAAAKDDEDAFGKKAK